MNRFNEIQKRIVELSERAHYEGIRHAGLSGTIGEDLLACELKQAIPQLNFSRGIVKYGDPKAKGHLLDESNLSTQRDLIAYKGQPLFSLMNNAVVAADQVICVMEIKKWAYPKLLAPGSKVLALIEAHKKTSPAPFLFVIFRFHDRVNKAVNWFSLRPNIPTEYAYCFFGNYTRSEGVINYPWQEKEWEKFEQSIYSGQFEKLVNDIKSFSGEIL